MSQAPSERPLSSLKRAATCLTIATLCFINMITICFAQITVYSSGDWCGNCKALKSFLSSGGKVPAKFNFNGTTQIDGVDVNFVHLPQNGTWPTDVKGVPAMRVGDQQVTGVNYNSLMEEIKKSKKDSDSGKDKPDDEGSGHNSDKQPDDDEENKPKPDSPKPGGCGPGGCPGGGGGGSGLGGGGLGGGGGLLAGIGQAAMQMLPQLLQGLMQGGLQGQGNQQGLTDLQTQEELDQAFLANYVFPTQTAIAQATAIAETATAVAEQEPEDTDNQNQDSESSTVQPTPTPNPYAF